jgi:hypothetical protein
MKLLPDPEYVQSSNPQKYQPPQHSMTPSVRTPQLSLLLPLSCVKLPTVAVREAPVAPQHSTAPSFRSPHVNPNEPLKTSADLNEGSG